MGDVFCGKCNKICYGEVLFARDEYYHQDCFKCKACLRDLATNGFYNHENEFYCTRDYQKLFGVKCTACGQFIEGDAISIFDDSFHETCFICMRCSNPFPPGAKVNLLGDDYVCDNCLPVDGKDNSEVGPEGLCAGCGNEIKSGQALLALDRQWHLWCFTCHKCGQLLSGEYLGRDGVPYCEKDYQDEFGISCAGCGGNITGRVLQAGEKHYHPQCSRCAKCGQMFGEGEEMYLQGSEIWHPECSDEYQREMEEDERLAYQKEQEEIARQQQEQEERERNERERAERERERAEREIAERERAERERAERERAERERADRERIERDRKERERGERERAERERAEKERAERQRLEREREEREIAERERAEKERADRERAERERAEYERAERERVERELAEREREERERGERERAEREAADRAREERQKESPRETGFRSVSPAVDNLAYSAKPFGGQKTAPSSISINFKPKSTIGTAGKWKPPETKPFEPSKTTSSYRPSQFTRTEVKTTTVTTTTKTDGGNHTSEKEESSPPVVNGYQKASSISSDEGAPARPPPPPTRGSSQNWKSRITDKRTTSPPTTQESSNESSFAPVNVDIDVRSANKPLTYIESASKRDDSRTDPKAAITVKSVAKTTDDAPVPNAIYRRLPNRDRDALRENRKSLPAMPDYSNGETMQLRSNGMSRNEVNAYHRRSLPSLDKYEDQGIRASTTYPYHVLKSNNYKMPKEIDKSRLETYLTDDDFADIFKVDRDDFYKQPLWKQRDMKKRVMLF